MPRGPVGHLAASATRAAAISAGKSVRYLSRALGRGGGTTLPGRVANRLDPELLRSLAQDLPNGCALVTGTNAKTTTTPFWRQTSAARVVRHR